MERGSNETGIPSSNNTPSPDQKPQVSNASLDLLSDYSSCEESEFERYCSANSVMGTPSMCSSVGTFNDFLDLDDGGVEFRSRNYNRDRRMSLSKIERWSRSLPTSEERSSVIRNGRGTSNGDNGLESAHNTNGETSLRRSMYGDNGSGDLSLLENSGVNGASQVIGVESKEEAHDAYDPFDVKESGNLEDEEISSRYELSDDDSSMGSYGMDDERRMGLYNMSNLHDLQNSESNNDNPLIVGSAVAFGSDDWHDFIQENEENNLVSSLFDIPEQEQQENRGTEGMLLNSVSLLPVSAPNIASSEQSRDVENGAKGREIQERFSNGGGFPQEKDFLADKGSRVDLNVTTIEREVQCIPNKEDNRSDVGTASENDSFGELELLNSLSNMSIFDRSLSTAGESHGQVAVHFQEQEVHELQAAIEDDFKATEMANSNYCPTSVDQSEEHPAPIKVGKLKDSYDELVLEMEEILLDSTGTPGSRFPQSNRSTRPFRDGSSTASTSGSVDSYPLVQILQKVDGVEVIGAKQKKGDVSLGERLVGVKEYTVYMLRVWSGNDQWEVERRYRDFFKLYRQLKTLYANHGWSLPTPWSSVEQESRKLFGNASPTIVSARSTLIQECLRSILHSDTPNSVPVTLNWFLFPEKIITSSSLLNTLSPQPPSILTGVTSIEDVPTFGKTISLLVEIQPHKSVKQLLEAQHYECAGCHKRFDTEKTLMQEFAHTLGWGKPRLCEYSGQLFCASCHTNETSVLPARVLHFWDFTEYPVSQMAKSYLDSIYDQPMLCVSAVNPFLFSKVPALLHLMGIRKKVGAMMPYVRCPFRRSIQKGVGSRRYLLENNEFFALRDLIDLSKGAFSVLPVMVQTVSTKILDHITQQCLVCCDVGIPCGARQTCEDPSSLIFPFQENEIKKCRSCESVFHKPCFKKIVSCPCGAGSDVRKIGSSAPDVSPKSNEALKTVAKRPDSGSPVRFLSYLFSNTRQEKELRHKNSNPVILMGSLPSTFSDPL